jgi:methylenetetrahydrofolate reductase (NADH)
VSEEPRSGLHRALLEGRFAVTAELETTDSATPESVHGLADRLRGNVDAVNCTDNSAAHPHISGLAAARLLIDRGVEPILQLACRDRNRLALQADILGAAALGVRNIVCMTGDDVTAGDHPEAKPIYDLDSIHLLRIARIMRDRGTYVSGRPLEDAPNILIGAVENPFAPPHEYRPMRLGKKMEAGAEFIQTQICFNVERLRLFMARSAELGLLENVWVLGGVFIPRSARAVRYLRDQVPGVDVPEEVLRRIEGVPAERQREEAIRLALEILEQIRTIPGIAGVHLMSIRNLDAILQVIDEARLRPGADRIEGLPAG